MQKQILPSGENSPKTSHLSRAATVVGHSDLADQVLAGTVSLNAADETSR